MKVTELIALLQKQAALRPEMEVMVIDEGGFPRNITHEPFIRPIFYDDAQETDDCDGRAGENVIVLGYGDRTRIREHRKPGAW